MTGSPIASQLTATGATYGERGGLRVPLHFGDPSSEYRAFKLGAAVIDRSQLARIEHAGSDALDLLHRLTTNDLLDLAEGRARPTIVTTGDARIVDILTVVRRSSQPLLLLALSADAARVIEWLDKYTFGEDSTLKDVTSETAQFTVAGPKSLEVLAAGARLPAVDLASDCCARVAIAGHQVDLIRTDRLVAPTVDIVVASALAEEVWRALTGAGATPAGALAYDAFRVARGIPEYGSELDERVNPHEANLIAMISFTKGCYIGQEVVARLDTYDKVQKRLVPVTSSQALRPGTLLSHGTGVDGGADGGAGRSVGEVRTVAVEGLLPGNPAIAYVRRSHWEKGTLLKSGDGAEVEVAAWPLE